MSKLLALVVVFGEEALSTAAVKSLLKLRDVHRSLRLVIWDNSPCPSKTVEISNSLLVEFIYKSTPENLGLSKIYNYVIENLLHSDDLLLLLDQDTQLPANFFLALSDMESRNKDVNLFLPIVRANSRLVSPLDFFLGWGRYWVKPKMGRISARGCMAINSGMAIRGSFLKTGFKGYDERLRFYGTDTQFMIDYSRTQKDLCVIDIELIHDLSFFSADGLSKARKFIEMKAANFIIYEKHPLHVRMAVSILMLLVSAVYAIRFRSAVYLRRHVD